MHIEMLKAKIHGATVTATDVNYEGSILVDGRLLQLAGILEFERVEVWDRTNGARFSTYAIAGETDSKVVMVNGAAAHLVNVGDDIIIATFVHMSPEQAKCHRPRIVLMSDHNNGQLKVEGA